VAKNLTSSADEKRLSEGDKTKTKSTFQKRTILNYVRTLKG
jgi:hypothetical protein